MSFVLKNFGQPEILSSFFISVNNYHESFIHMVIEYCGMVRMQWLRYNSDVRLAVLVFEKSLVLHCPVGQC